MIVNYGDEGTIGMIEVYVDMAYEEDQHGLDRLVLHDIEGEMPDAYYVRVGRRDWDDVEEE